MDDKFAAVIYSEAQNREVGDNILVLYFDHCILAFLGISNILGRETNTPRYSGVVIDDDKEILVASTQGGTGTL